MKTYSSSYTPLPFVTLATSRKLDMAQLEQAIDSVLTGVKVKTEFVGLVKVKGEKGEFDMINEAVGRMPAGTVRDCLVYFGKVRKAVKSAKTVSGTVTLTDFPAGLSEWFLGFTVKPARKTSAGVTPAPVPAS